MEFREITNEDLEYMKVHSLHPDFYKEAPEKRDHEWTLQHNGSVLVIGGLRMINRTTAWGWFDLSDMSGEHIIVVYRTVKEWLEIAAKEMGLRRVEAYVAAGFEAGERTVQHLGFTLECRMRNFIGDQPADLWVRFFGDNT